MQWVKECHSSAARNANKAKYTSSDDFLFPTWWESETLGNIWMQVESHNCFNSDSNAAQDTMAHTQVGESNKVLSCGCHCGKFNLGIVR